LYRRPATTFVASFVGYPPMNIVAGRFDGDFRVQGLTVPVSNGHAAGPGHLGIRPEDIRLGGQHPAKLVLVEPLGKEALLTLDVGGVGLKATVPAESVPAPNSQLLVDFPQDRLHLFDAQGQRLAL
ncbi:MAG TPA: TOBE domain-containing protein, partial [Trueperaceae bacterium]|nr:TOBE domain-containing protein [Trueperaceae bacterium]